MGVSRQILSSQLQQQWNKLLVGTWPHDMLVMLADIRQVNEGYHIYLWDYQVQGKEINGQFLTILNYLQLVVLKWIATMVK